MRLISILAFLFLLPAWTHAHPLHLSITNITYENGKLKVSMKTFRDDWEIAYFQDYSKVVDFTHQRQRAMPWFGDYLKDRFWLALNKGDRKQNLEIDTVMLGEDSMTLEMHSTVPGEPNSLYIYNALLTDIYPDQTNLVIFGFKNRETGMKFDVKKHDAEVMLK